STIADNYVFGRSGEAAGISNFGLAIDHDVSILTMRDSTIAGNSGGEAGAILGGPVGSISIDNCTIAANSVPFGGIFTNGSPLYMRNTFLAGNGGALYGTLSSSGHNLIGNTLGGSGYADTDLLNVDPLLGPLQNNGGPTQTMALLPGSPALNA